MTLNELIKLAERHGQTGYDNASPVRFDSRQDFLDFCDDFEAKIRAEEGEKMISWLTELKQRIAALREVGKE